jgi:hypothetical protein
MSYDGMAKNIYNLFRGFAHRRQQLAGLECRLVLNSTLHRIQKMGLFMTCSGGEIDRWEIYST